MLTVHPTILIMDFYEQHFFFFFSILNLWDEEMKEKRHLMDSNTRGVKKGSKN